MLTDQVRQHLRVDLVYSSGDMVGAVAVIVHLQRKIWISQRLFRLLGKDSLYKRDLQWRFSIVVAHPIEMAGADARKERVVDEVRGVECVQNLDILLLGQIDQILIVVDQFTLLLLS